jgi:hypothetical protein
LKFILLSLTELKNLREFIILLDKHLSIQWIVVYVWIWHNYKKKNSSLWMEISVAVCCTLFLEKVFDVCLMVFYATSTNISVISWRSVLLVEESGGPGENHRPAASHWQTLSLKWHFITRRVIYNLLRWWFSDII